MSVIYKHFLQITPDGKKKESEDEPATKKIEVIRSESEENPVESFFDLLSRCQSERMDEQRATLNSNKENRPKPKSITNKLQRSASSGNKNNRSVLFDIIKTAKPNILKRNIRPAKFRYVYCQ